MVCPCTWHAPGQSRQTQVLPAPNARKTSCHASLALGAGYSGPQPHSPSPPPHQLSSASPPFLPCPVVSPCPLRLPTLHFVIFSLTRLSVVSSHPVTHSGISVCLAFPPAYPHTIQLAFHPFFTTNPAYPLDQPFQFLLDIQPLDPASVSCSCVIPAPLIFPSPLLSKLLWNLFQTLHVTALLLQMIFATSSPSSCPPSSLAPFWSSSFKCSSSQPVTYR